MYCSIYSLLLSVLASSLVFPVNAKHSSSSLSHARRSLSLKNRAPDDGLLGGVGGVLGGVGSDGGGLLGGELPLEHRLSFPRVQPQPAALPRRQLSPPLLRLSPPLPPVQQHLPVMDFWVSGLVVRLPQLVLAVMDYWVLASVALPRLRPHRRPLVSLHPRHPLQPQPLLPLPLRRVTVFLGSALVALRPRRVLLHPHQLLAKIPP
ncbi:hypothetical protein BV22DRAFT_400619 [Leucogyrophana mollusca]|uniref:Uncharacterized protein n=1 Tax=Leucogyrophana mollusca TaxID=85980 RepID=A0ACB8BLY4_9AGAM|nr:hypothetical protein BV22DRAFT_400619 [Leucogyrophana mollusca]